MTFSIYSASSSSLRSSESIDMLITLRAGPFDFYLLLTNKLNAPCNSNKSPILRTLSSLASVSSLTSALFVCSRWPKTNEFPPAVIDSVLASNASSADDVSGVRSLPSDRLRLSSLCSRLDAVVAFVILPSVAPMVFNPAMEVVLR